jgi:hypothetical protein
MSVPHKAQPDGFSIWHSRHGKLWCWRQTEKVQESKALGHVVERTGIRTRPAALADIHEELERRRRVANAAATVTEVDQATTGVRGA